MSGNVISTPIQESFTKGTNKNINDFSQLQGKQLPCHVVAKAANNSTVTIAFDVSSEFTLPSVTVPVLGFEYVRYPIQIGDKGVAISCDTRIGNSSGLGQGTPDLSQPANLSALVFVPVGNINWSSVDPSALTLYGSNGVVIRDSASNSIITITPTAITIVSPSSVSITSAGSSVTLAADGSFNISGSASSSISASGGLSLSDGVNTAVISAMHTAFNSMITWMNTHVHSNPEGGNTGVSNPQYTGGNPIS